jgi:hypothetical protein
MTREHSPVGQNGQFGRNRLCVADAPEAQDREGEGQRTTDGGAGDDLASSRDDSVVHRALLGPLLGQRRPGNGYGRQGPPLPAAVG